VQQLLSAQPVDQVGTVGGVEDRSERVGFAQALDVMCDRQQVQVMIAQHGDG